MVFPEHGPGETNYVEHTLTGLGRYLKILLLAILRIKITVHIPPGIMCGAQFIYGNLFHAMYGHPVKIRID